MYGDALRQLAQCMILSDRLARRFPALAAAMEAAARAIYATSQKLKACRDAAGYHIRAGDMPPPRFSWWRWLLRKGSRGAFIRFTGVSRTLFGELVDLARGHAEYKERPTYKDEFAAGVSSERSVDVEEAEAAAAAAAAAAAPPKAKRAKKGVPAEAAAPARSAAFGGRCASCASCSTCGTAAVGKRMRGGQLEMGSADCIALTFRYIFGASESLGLQGLFYISSAALSKALKHGKKLALYALQLHPDAKVLWPTFAEQIRNAKLMMRGGPAARGPPPGTTCFAFGWVDGVCYRCSKCGNKEIERMGWSLKKQMCEFSPRFELGISPPPPVSASTNPCTPPTIDTFLRLH